MGERIQFDKYLPLSQFAVILILNLFKLLRFYLNTDTAISKKFEEMKILFLKKNHWMFYRNPILTLVFTKRDLDTRHAGIARNISIEED